MSLLSKVINKTYFSNMTVMKMSDDFPDTTTLSENKHEIPICDYKTDT